MSDSPPLEEALALLRAVVADFRARGRTTLAAGIKPELQRRGPDGFDEHLLGFDRFADFLEFAASRGAVVVTRAGGQPVVGLPGDRSPAARVTAREGGRRRPRVRRDIWEAFTNWGNWRRGWDKTEQRAVRLPENTAHETSSTKATREAWDAQPDRFVEIPGIPQEEQLAWMRDFAAEQSGRTGLLLRYGLKEEDRKAQAFSEAIREEPAVFARWQDMRVQKVIDAIESWKAEQGVEIDILEGESRAERVEVVPTEHPGPLPATLADADLRILAHRAIDAMTPEELLKLPLLLGHIARRSSN